MTTIPDLVAAAMQAAPENLEKAIIILKGKSPVEVAPVEPLLTAVEVAKRLNVSLVSIYRWSPPSIPMAGKPRFRMSSVLQYLESEEFKLHAAALRRERNKKRKAGK
jgi:hypothetical protein